MQRPADELQASRGLEREQAFRDGVQIRRQRHLDANVAVARFVVAVAVGQQRDAKLRRRVR